MDSFVSFILAMVRSRIVSSAIKGHGILFGVGDSGITTRFGGSGVTEWIRSSKTFCI